jgi:hypothetical protein
MQCGEKIKADLKSYVVWAHTPDEVKIVKKSIFLLKKKQVPKRKSIHLGTCPPSLNIQ